MVASTACLTKAGSPVRKSARLLASASLKESKSQENLLKELKTVKSETLKKGRTTASAKKSVTKVTAKSKTTATENATSTSKATSTSAVNTAESSAVTATTTATATKTAPVVSKTALAVKEKASIKANTVGSNKNNNNNNNNNKTSPISKDKVNSSTVAKAKTGSDNIASSKHKTLKANIKRTGGKGKGTKGVIYIGHLPRGFYEPQLFKFLSQFGKVERIKLYRSKKTAHSKGYAFVEFELEKVAEIVANTMNQYRMFGRTLVSHVISPEKQSPLLFKGSSKRFKRLPIHVMESKRHNCDIDSEMPQKRLERMQKKRLSKSKNLAKLGIDYEL